VAAVAIAALQASAPLAAQEKPERKGGVVTTVEVEILSLDVLALDQKDGPVLGLKQEDFEVKVAGKVQPFEFFEPPRGPSRRGEADSPEHFAGSAEPVKSDGRPLPHVLFFVDLEQLPKGAIRDAAAAIQETGGRVAGSARIGLVAQFGGAQALAWDTNSIEHVLPELEAIHDAALQSSVSVAVRSIASDRAATGAPLALEARLSLENMLIDDIVAAERAGGDASAAYQALARFLASETDRVKRAVENLRDVCGRFATLEGSRHLVYVSQGIERVPGLNVVTRLQAARASSRNPFGAGTALAVPGQVPRTEASRLGFVPMPLVDLDELRNGLAASGITFHFLDAMPLGADLATAEDRYASSAGQRTNERRALEDSALRMVDATGGISRLTPGDLKASFDTFLDAAASTYRMGVRLTDVDTRRTYKVSVTVKKGGVTARARSAYRPKGNAAVAALASTLAGEAGSARLKAAADSKRPGALRLAKKPLTVSVAWKRKSTMSSKEPGKAFYRLEVAVPHDELRFNPEEDSMVASVRIVVEAKGLEGSFSETFTDDLFVSFSGPEYKEARGTNATRTVTLLLPPGRYELNVTVNDALEGSFGSATQRVEAEK
jgi:hypothetical protein